MFPDPTLEAVGDTPLGEAITQGIDLIKKRKDEYRANGISFYRPWIFLITDGSPTDKWEHAFALSVKGKIQRRLLFLRSASRGSGYEYSPPDISTRT